MMILICCLVNRSASCSVRDMEVHQSKIRLHTFASSSRRCSQCFEFAALLLYLVLYAVCLIVVLQELACPTLGLSVELVCAG